MKAFDHVIIGAGMAGLTLRRFLKGDRIALIDPRPCGYKIGESIIPEHFHDLDVRALVPKIRQLKSYTRKWGSMFITDETIAAFPLPENLSAISMHIERAELEKLMIEEWGIEVIKERVTGVDVAARTVTTDGGTYKSAGPIVDCSGPAMVVARALGEVQEILPAHSIWSYYDITTARKWNAAQLAEATGKEVLNYDLTRGTLLDGEIAEGWSADQTTVLTQIREGVWLWQIPLFNGTILSTGVVSRKESFDEQAYEEVVEAHKMPCFDLAKRPRDGSSDYNKLHVRKHFATRARVASTSDYILVADAFAFGDPIYSVGTGLAVNKAIQVADMLSDGGAWDAERSEWYNAQYERLLVAAMGAFQHWYTGDLVSSGEVAGAVQTGLLQGEVFGNDIAEWYNASIRCSMGDPDDGRHDKFPDLDGV